MEKPQNTQVETVEAVESPDSSRAASLSRAVTEKSIDGVVGTVRMITKNETVLIPTPSSDPKGTKSIYRIFFLESVAPDDLRPYLMEF